MRDFETVYGIVRNIPRGRVMSYGGVGLVAGVTPRTVGWAMANVPDGVPWHRVVAHDGYLSIAKRGPHLRNLQESLLKEEGVVVSEAGYVERRFFVGEEQGSESPDVP